MTPPSTPLRSPRNTDRFPRWLIVLLLTPLIIVVGLLLWHVRWRMANTAAIQRLEAAAQQRGEPLTLASLATNYPAVPDSENAAAALMALWEKDDPRFWKAFHNGDRPLPERARHVHDPALPYLSNRGRNIARNTRLTAASTAAADEWMKARAAHTEAVRAALQLPHFRFPLKFDEGYMMLMPHLAVLKEEASGFLIEAALATDCGDLDKAIGALHDTARVGQLLADEPCLISQLVRIACLNMAINGTERLLSQRELNASQLAQVSRLAESLEVSGALRRSFICERAASLSIFTDSGRTLAETARLSDDASSDPEREAQTYRLGLGLMQSVGWAGAERRLMLETFNKVIMLAEQDTAQALNETEETVKRAVKEARQFPPKILSGLLLPSMEKVRPKFAALEARRRAGVVALSIERFRLTHQGALPEQLDRLVPGFLARVPTDPFDGQPLRFRRLEKGYVVYSVGHDRKDNNGRERDPKGKQREFDETFIVER
ncbi:MAG: hypothetical protein HZA90_01770 [Verrucomicrobia bacterium]|nr:hypothetical protein [Verrucomicrobiota bacterium]